MTTTAAPINVFEYEEAARGLLSPEDYDGIAGGATDELTLARTRRAFDSLALRPRMLQDVSNLDLSTTVLGTQVSFPIFTAPAGGHAKSHPDGELATAQAAGALGTLMVVSAHSSYSLEEIAEVASGPLWFQMYLFIDRDVTLAWVRRAEAVGCKALCVTVDANSPPKRERAIRNKARREDGSGFGPNYAHLRPDQLPDLSGGVVVPQTARGMTSRSAGWEEIDWLKEQTSLPIVLKGLMTGEDAALAAEHGVDGIVVSNHGARNIDTTLATIEVLPEVVEAVQGKVEVLLDGGVRRGTDVVKALALGARAVLIGRPIFWGLAVDGAAGLQRLMAILREEMEGAMALCGRPTIASLDPSLVTRMPPL
jgi:4-hydroxymandelate oxidase